MGSGKGSTSTSSVQIPQAVLDRYTAVNQTAEQAASHPFTPYSGEFVAPINSTQQAGIANTNTAATSAQPYFDQAKGYVTAGGNAVNPSDLSSGAINKYLSPYLNTVLGSESALLNQNNQQQQSGQLGTAIRSGAFGGDRGGIAAANLAQQQNLANANIYSNILNQGYNNALGVAQQQQGVQLSADQANRAAQQQTGLNLAGLGTAAQTAGLQGAQAQIGAGQVAQNTQQAQDTALYNQFLQQMSFPYQQAQFLAGIAEGTGSLSGSTTTTNSSQNGIFSDRRLKTSVHKVGKTFDGQDIYTYKYKGHPDTHMGLMAQDVEETHPEAVGLASGYKTVDYRKATDDAAKRGHFAGGGGAYDPSNWQEMLGAYQQMYAPLLNAKSGLGAGSIVPETPGQSHTLAVAQNPTPKQDSLLHDASSLAGDVDAIGKAGDKFGAWSYVHKDGDDSDGYARGGLASGGNPDDMPYGGDHGLDIPDDQQKFTLNAAKPANAPNSNPLGDLKDIASIASTIAAFARGGRAKRADGGATDAFSGSNGKPPPWPPKRADGGDVLADAFSGSNGKPPPFPKKRADGGATDEYRDVDNDIASLQKALRLAYQAQHDRMADNSQDQDNSASDAIPDDTSANLATPAAHELTGLGSGQPSPDALPTPAKGGKLDPDVVSYFKQKGLPEDIARGIAAGIYAESGNNPNAVNPSSGALGLGQHLGPRKASLVSLYGEHPSKSQQLDFILNELKGGDRGGKSVLNAPDEASALSAYIRNFMRPAAGAETTGDLARGLGALRKGFAYGGGPTDPDRAASSFDIPDLDDSSDEPDVPASGLASAPANLLPQNFNDNDIPPAEAPRRAAGLGSADLLDPQGAVAYGASTPDYYGSGRNSLDQSLRDNVKHGRTDVVLPILKGLAAFGTANTNNPLTALVTGLGAGADAYQSQRDFENKRAQTAQELALRNRTVGLSGYQAGLEGAMLPYNQAVSQAQAGQIGAQTARTQALIPSEVQEMTERARLIGAQALGVPANYTDVKPIPGVGMFVTNRAHPEESHLVTNDDIRHVLGNGVGPENGLGAPQPAGPTGQPPAPNGQATPPAPSAPPAKPSGWRPVTAATNVTIPSSYYLQGDAVLNQERASSADTYKQLEQSARDASASQGELVKLAHQYQDLPQSGFTAPGFGGGARTQIVKEANALLNTFGLPPIADTAAGESMAKFTNTLGIKLARSLGAHEAASVVDTAIRSNPGIENSPIAFKRLTSSLYEEAQRQKDMAAYYNDWIGRSGGTLKGAREAFDRDNPPQAYAIRAIMKTVDPRHAALLKSDPNGYRKDFDRMYGQGVSNYFLGK